MDVPTSQVRLLSEAFKTTPDFIAADVAAVYAAAGPTLPASSIAASASNASSAASVSHTHTQRIGALLQQTGTSSNPVAQVSSPSAQGLPATPVVKDPRYLYFGVNVGMSGEHKVVALRTDGMAADADLFAELKDRYLALRGPLRTCFSWWRYDHCEFFRVRRSH